MLSPVTGFSGKLEMRFIHTSDWHLGRLFHGVHLTEDQAGVLDQFVDLVRDTAPDAVLIAGDVYDRSVPPPEAVSLLDETLSAIAIGLNVPVLLIAGNHDSPERLGFGARLMARQKVHAVGSLPEQPLPVILEDSFGQVYFYCVPYAEPPVVREKLADENIRDHDAAAGALMEQIRNIHPSGKRSVLMAHAFVAGGELSESERPLSVGGTGSVRAACFQDFDYVALGHLHRLQCVTGEKIQYSGSLMKYSFSEADHGKAINIVELDEAGLKKIQKVSLKPKRDVRRLKGSLSELLAAGRSAEHRNDYISVELLDKGAIFDAMGQLREVYPNVLHIERPFLEIGGDLKNPRGDHRKIDDLELFSSFYSQVTGEDLSEPQEQAYAAVVDDLRRSQREGA